MPALTFQLSQWTSPRTGPDTASPGQSGRTAGGGKCSAREKGTQFQGLSPGTPRRWFLWSSFAIVLSSVPQSACSLTAGPEDAAALRPVPRSSHTRRTSHMCDLRGSRSVLPGALAVHALPEPISAPAQARGRPGAGTPAPQASRVAGMFFLQEQRQLRLKTTASHCSPFRDPCQFYHLSNLDSAER